MRSSERVASVLGRFVDDLRTLGRVRVIFRVHGGLGDVTCDAAELRVDDEWLVVRTADCTLQLARASLASAEVLAPEYGESEGSGPHACVWFFAACGVPALGVMLDRRRAASCPQLRALVALRQRWMGRVTFAAAMAPAGASRTVH